MKCKHQDKNENSLLRYKNKVKDEHFHLYVCDKCKKEFWLKDMTYYLEECDKAEEVIQKRLAEMDTPKPKKKAKKKIKTNSKHIEVFK